jgi:ABC-type cobalamin/Fe3+-siderophores transport system ATPase subunit
MRHAVCEMDELLSLREVCLHYVRGARHMVRVLEGVSLDMRAGEVVCVWGQRGQGKTTLLRVAAGLSRPADGRVLFEGRDVWEMADEQRGRLLGGGIGWVELVAPEAVGAPVVDVVAMPVLRAGGRPEAYERARRALEVVGASRCAEHGWGSLDEPERARVALARGIVHEPKLLVVDDLTAMLGARAADELGELLAWWAHEQGVGVLASVSSLNATTWSDRVATLYAGELMVPPRAGRGGGVRWSNCAADRRLQAGRGAVCLYVVRISA